MGADFILKGSAEKMQAMKRTCGRVQDHDIMLDGHVSLHLSDGLFICLRENAKTTGCFSITPGRTY